MLRAIIIVLACGDLRELLTSSHWRGSSTVSWRAAVRIGVCSVGFEGGIGDIALSGAMVCGVQ